MSAKSKAILKALEAKGYTVGEVKWSPVRRGGIMGGPEGGWAVNIKAPRPNTVESYILRYNAAEVLERIAELPVNQP